MTQNTQNSMTDPTATRNSNVFQILRKNICINETKYQWYRIIVVIAKNHSSNTSNDDDDYDNEYKNNLRINK